MAAAEWKFLLDENIARTAVQQLTQRGFQADLVVDVLDPGVSDYTATQKI